MDIWGVHVGFLAPVVSPSKRQVTKKAASKDRFNYFNFSINSSIVNFSCSPVSMFFKDN